MRLGPTRCTMNPAGMASSNPDREKTDINRLAVVRSSLKASINTGITGGTLYWLTGMAMAATKRAPTTIHAFRLDICPPRISVSALTATPAV